MTSRTTKSVEARTAARTMADPAEVRKVIDKLYKGERFLNACFQYRITPAQFWKRVRSDRDLRREMAAACITQAWDRANGATEEDLRHLPVFAKLSRDMAASLAPDDWGEKVQVEATKLVINTNLDFGVVTGFDAVARGARVTIEGEATGATDAQEPVDEE